LLPEYFLFHWQKSTNHWILGLCQLAHYNNLINNIIVNNNYGIDIEGGSSNNILTNNNRHSYIIQLWSK